jgi:hypothetical protein
VANPSVIILKESDNLDYVMKQFGRNEMDELPVVSANGDGKIIGTIWQTDVISAYNHQIFLRDMSGEMSQGVRDVTTEKTVHVIENYHLSEIEVPSSLFNKTLESAALRKRFNVEVLLIRRTIIEGNERKNMYIQPGGQTVLQMNDMLLVFGEQTDIDRFGKI